MSIRSYSYRPEVDGLRAIAVISVIFYHAQIAIFGRDWFEGGFIGVDIFFVISGYLITRIILSELESQNSFSFRNFYDKRARRILPMLFVIILTSAPFAFIWLLPTDLASYSESILASLAFGSNFFFYFSNTDYGADSALLKPFLHTWSLGVEEQFYLFFPFIAIIAFRYFRALLMPIIVALSLLSLLFCLFMESRNSELNFFLPYSRFWELSAGSILAYRELYQKTPANRVFERALPPLGLCLVLCSILFFDSETPHPSLLTVIPVLGVSLLIGFSSKDEVIGSILGNRLFVWIGLISYSLYLWHFPIFALSRNVSLTHTNFDKAGWIFLTFGLSILSYWIVEKPFRSKVTVSGKAFSIALLVSFLSSIAIFMLIANGLIVNSKNRDSMVAKLMDKSAYREEHRAFELNYDYSIADNDKKNILVVGNSHGEDLLKALNFSSIRDSHNLNIISPQRRTKDINYQIGCFRHFLQEKNTTCTQGATQETIEYAPNIQKQYSSADVIILATLWKNSDLEILPELIKNLIEDNKKVIVVSNTPQSKTFGERKLNRFDRFIFDNKENNLPSEPELAKLETDFYLDYIKNQSAINKRLEMLVERISDNRVGYARRSDFMCDTARQRCFLFFPRPGVKIIWDYGHTTTEGARLLSGIIDEKQWLKDFL